MAIGVRPRVRGRRIGRAHVSGRVVAARSVSGRRRELQRLTAAGPVGWGQLSRPTAVAGATGRRGPSMARGLRQEDRLHDMKVSRQTINAIETGRYLPSLPLAIALARYFGKRVEDLFHGDQDER